MMMTRVLGPVGRAQVPPMLGAAMAQRQVHCEARLSKLGHVLPAVSPPKGSYVLAQWADAKTLHLAGHLPKSPQGELICGKVGKDVTVEQARKAAESAALSLLATLKATLGDLDKVQQIVKV